MTASTSFRRAAGSMRDATALDLAPQPARRRPRGGRRSSPPRSTRRALVIGAEVPRLLQLVLVLEAFAARAVPAGVLARGRRRPGRRASWRRTSFDPERQDAARVALLGRADEVVVADVEAPPELAELGRRSGRSAAARGSPSRGRCARCSGRARRCPSAGRPRGRRAAAPASPRRPRWSCRRAPRGARR